MAWEKRLTGRGAGIAAFVTSVVGLPGTFDDLSTWEEWFGIASRWADQISVYQQVAPFLFFGALGYGLFLLSKWLWRLIKGRMASVGFTKVTAVPVEGIEDIERFQAELVKYLAAMPRGPLGTQDIALAQALLPFAEKARRVLDEQGIPHPQIDVGVMFEGPLNWGKFLARVLAVGDDVEKARKVYLQMTEGT